MEVKLYNTEIHNEWEGSKYMALNYSKKWKELLKQFRKFKKHRFSYATKSEFISFNIYYYFFYLLTSKKIKLNLFGELWIDKRWGEGRWVSTCKYFKHFKKSELFNTRAKYYFK